MPHVIAKTRTVNDGFFVNGRGTTSMIDPPLQGFEMPIMIDMPILPRNVPRLDAVQVTHSDKDHYSIPTLRDLAPVTKVFHSTSYVSSPMQTHGWRASGHAIGDAFTVGAVRVTLTERLAMRFERYLKSGAGHAFASRHFEDER